MVESVFTFIFVNTFSISFYSHFHTFSYISINTKAIANASYLCGNLLSAGQPIYLNKSMEVFKSRGFFLPSFNAFKRKITKVKFRIKTTLMISIMLAWNRNSISQLLFFILGLKLTYMCIKIKLKPRCMVYMKNRTFK